MSRRRPPPPPPPDPLAELDVLDPPPPEPEPEPDDDPEELLVEYFVDVLELLSVRTSVPKSAQSSQTSSSAPSTFTVFGDPVSAPHISQLTMSCLRHADA
jgi:hypothetical protein